MNPVSGTVRLLGRMSSLLVRLTAFGYFVITASAYPRQAAQSSADSNSQPQTIANLQHLVETPAGSGYEREATDFRRSRLSSFKTTTDNLGDMVVTVGSGEPRRLLITPLDEPGFVVSGITDDGFLR